MSDFLEKAWTFVEGLVKYGSAAPKTAVDAFEVNAGGEVHSKFGRSYHFYKGRGSLG